MNAGPDFYPLFRNSLSALLWGAIVVFLCDRFVDRPVALFVAERKLPADHVLRWLTEPPPILQSFTPAILAALMIRRVFGPFRRGERAVIAACLSMVLADQFRESLSYLFGRDWPETWINNNPSLIKDGAYGFHPFHGGERFGSFPSGHMARMLAVAASLRFAYPVGAVLCTLLSTAVGIGLVGMNYHFVGDVIAGGLVGAIVGEYVAYFAALRTTASPEIRTAPAGEAP